MISRIAATWSGPPGTVTAPAAAARSIASCFMSVAITVAPVSAVRICTAICPSPPRPTTSAYLPPPASLGSDSLMAWYGVRPASARGAAATGSASPSGTRLRAGVTMYSAMPPSRPIPVAAHGMVAAFSQYVSWPREQALQCPHPLGPYTRYASPLVNPVTPGPSSSIQPDASWPSTKGGANDPGCPSANSL